MKKNACVVMSHFECDGTGHMCACCGESEAACGCDDPEPETCEDCDGAGRICVTHESPVGDVKSPPQCDKAKEKKV